MAQNRFTHAYHLLRSCIHVTSEGDRTTFRFDGRTFERQHFRDRRSFAPGSWLPADGIGDLFVSSAWLAQHPEVCLPAPEDGAVRVLKGYIRTPVTVTYVAADPVAGRTRITFTFTAGGAEHQVDRDDLHRIATDGNLCEEGVLALSAEYLDELAAWPSAAGAAAADPQPDCWHELIFYGRPDADATVLEVDGEEVTFEVRDDRGSSRVYTADLGDLLSVAPFPATTLRAVVGARGRVFLSRPFLERHGSTSAA